MGDASAGVGVAQSSAERMGRQQNWRRHGVRAAPQEVLTQCGYEYELMWSGFFFSSTSIFFFVLPLISKQLSSPKEMR